VRGTGVVTRRDVRDRYDRELDAVVRRIETGECSASFGAALAFSLGAQYAADAAMATVEPEVPNAT
jgi:hypothetical protein